MIPGNIYTIIVGPTSQPQYCRDVPAKYIGPGCIAQFHEFQTVEALSRRAIVHASQIKVPESENIMPTPSPQETPLDREKWTKEQYVKAIAEARRLSERHVRESARLTTYANDMVKEMVKFDVSDLPMFKK